MDDGAAAGAASAAGAAVAGECHCVQPEGEAQPRRDARVDGHARTGQSPRGTEDARRLLGACHTKLNAFFVRRLLHRARKRHAVPGSAWRFTGCRSTPAALTHVSSRSTPLAPVSACTFHCQLRHQGTCRILGHHRPQNYGTRFADFEMLWGDENRGTPL